MLIQNSDKNFEFLFDMMFSEKSQSVMNKRFNNAFAYCVASHVSFSKIILIRLNALSVTVNIELNCFENVTIKFIVMILKNMIEVIININF